MRRFLEDRGFAPVVTAAILALLAGLPGNLRGQSLLGASSLGFPLEAVDARSRSLGSLGVGLFGPSILPTDPAAAADLRIPAIAMTFQGTWMDAEGPAEPTARGTRFPVLGIAYPVGRAGMATLTAGSVFDQRWRATQERVLDLGAEETRAVDTFISDGGVSALRLGFARRIAPSLAVGVAFGTYTGEVTRRFTRQFDSTSLGTPVPSLNIGGAWDYGGPTASLGVSVDVGEFLRASGTVTWSGDLKAEPTAETEGGGASFDIPMEYRLGASGVLAPRLTMVAAVSYADWSGTVSGEPDTAAGSSALGLGVGLEWEGASLVGSSSPFRFGYRHRDLPFGFGGESGSESVWSGGIGLNLVEAENIPLARIDLGLERGSRSGGALTESFWRGSVTLRVANF